MLRREKIESALKMVLIIVTNRRETRKQENIGEKLVLANEIEKAEKWGCQKIWSLK